MIEVRDLVKEYPMGAVTLQALKGVSFKVESGEVVAIMGPAGAGKSTLLHLMAGLDIPSRGQVLCDGQVISAMSDAKRTTLRNQRIGIVFQLYHLLPELSALENVMLPGLVNGSRRRKALRERAKACLGDVGLAGRLHHRPRQLSGGEQQRVAIARALVNEPKLLLCDEPTGNLDSATGEEIVQLLMELSREQQKSLVLVTHEANFAAKANRTWILRDGQLVTDAKEQIAHST